MSPEREPAPAMTEAQEAALRDLCERYEVEYAPEHYIVNSYGAWALPGYAEGWLGGPPHANPQYAEPSEPRGKPTLFVGVSPEGRVHS